MLLLGLTSYAIIFAQQPVINFDNFSPIYSTGELPPEVSMSGNDFVESHRESVMNEGGKKNRKAKKQFLLSSSYNIKDLFVSGRVLYNDPLSVYVEKVRKVVTAADPQLQDQTKVFIIKSSVVNAFATHQGYIFITTGLLAKLENEAQLAFILCHELIHYKNKHVVKSYVESVKIDRENGSYQKNNIDAKYLAKANYSRENESEADMLGFELYAKSGYSAQAVSDVFTVLKFAEEPIENYTFETKNLLETQYLVLPDAYYLAEIDEITGDDEDSDDSRSTHPNLKRRRADITTQIASTPNLDNGERSNYLVSEVEFNTVKKLARFDLCHTNLIDRDYDLAIYQAYCLMHDYGNNTYLKKCVLKGLYGLYKYSNAKRFDEVCYNYKKMEGEFQRVTFLFSQMKADELDVIALNYGWRLKKELKDNDVEVNVIVDDLFFDLAKHHHHDKSFFSLTAASDTLKTQEPEEEKKDEKSRSRIGKYKKKKEETKGYIAYAFVDLLQDNDFSSTYDAMIKKSSGKGVESEVAVKTKKRKNKALKYDINTTDWQEQNVNEGKYNEDKDLYALGIDKVIIVNPFYLQIDERKTSPIIYAGTEDKQTQFNKNIAELSKTINLDVEIIDKHKLTTTSIDYYNDMAVLIDWIDERADHKTMEILPTDYLKIEEITKKYGTEHISFMGAIKFIEKKNPYKNIIYGVLCMIPYTWFVTIPYFIKRLDHTYVYTTVFNLRTGQPEMVKYGQSPSNDREFVVKSFLYDYLKQIKRTGKNR